MPSIKVIDTEKKSVGEVELSPALFEAKVNRPLLHEVVTQARSNQRAGTRGVKGRSDVRGGGRKPWKQKGTGRARAGTIRSPIWRGGGVVFGPQAKNYDVRIPRKKRQAALKSAFTWKFQAGRLAVLEKMEVKEGKTREVAGWLDKGGWLEGGALLVHTEESPLLARAANNLPGVKVTKPSGINLYDLFLFRNLLLTREALDKIEEVWGK